jgi:regulator of replication initiation timing
MDYSMAIKRLQKLVEQMVSRYEAVCEENEMLRAELEELKNARGRQDPAT